VFFFAPVNTSGLPLGTAKRIPESRRRGLDGNAGRAGIAMIALFRFAPFW
jgi:hypothetical protein